MIKNKKIVIWIIGILIVLVATVVILVAYIQNSKRVENNSNSIIISYQDDNIQKSDKPKSDKIPSVSEIAQTEEEEEETEKESKITTEKKSNDEYQSKTSSNKSLTTTEPYIVYYNQTKINSTNKTVTKNDKYTATSKQRTTSMHTTHKESDFTSKTNNIEETKSNYTTNK